MSRVWARLRGVKAVVCLLWVCFGLLLNRRAWAEALVPVEIEASDAEPGVVVYPSRVSGARPITVLLHGMCGDAARACSHFASEVSQSEHLICPRATQRCSGGGASWPQTEFEPAIEAAVQRALTALGENVDPNASRTLIGYSLGAFRALDIAENARGRYARVMLIGAKVFPNSARLRENGVVRLLMSAGEWDMMSAHMQRETARLTRRGFDARFLGLGPVGHAFTPSFSRYLPDALEWLHQPEGGTHAL